MKVLEFKKISQIMAFFLYTLAIILISISISIRSRLDTDELQVAFFIITGTELLLGIATVWKRVTNVVQGSMMILFTEGMLMFFVFKTEDYNFLYIGNFILIFFVSIYQDVRIGMMAILCFFIAGVVSTIMKALDSSYGSAAAVVNSFIFFGIIASMVHTTSIVSKIKRQNKIIRENRTSSQDMIKVVEMKRHEAEEAAKAKSMFLSNMSHEIRTPINSILGMDEIILKESNELNIIEYASNIQNAGKTLLSIVNDILDLSKIESGKMGIVNDKYKISEVLNELYNLIYIKAEEKGLRLTFEVIPELPSVMYGDALRIKQILLNVLNNAVKYTEKGFVNFKVNILGYDNKEIGLLFSVEDSGVGIKKENQTRIFNSFERVDEASDRAVEGTGLGMSITRNLVSLMNGRIYLESESGKGSTFYVELNQKVLDETPIGKFTPKTVYDVGKYREHFEAPDVKILVVDDNEMNLAVVKGLLKETKMQIDTAASGAMAIDMVKQTSYNMILMDHMMPGMDGIETLNAMRKLSDNQSADAVYIALTANAIAGAREVYINAGFTDYLSKPVSGAMLEKILKKYIPSDSITTSYLEDTDKQEPVVDDGMYINRASGMKYMGDNNELYNENLGIFFNSSPEKQDLVREYFDAKDWKKYAIEVHALKSNAAYIGAEGLRELALAHEKAAKEFDEEFIINHVDELFTEWHNVNEEIRTIFDEAPKQYRNKGTLPEDEIKSRISKISELLAEFESDGAEHMLRELASYDLGDMYNEKLQKAGEFINNFNYQKAIDILSQ